MSWLTSFLHPGKSYGDAQNVLTKYYNEGVGYQQPYNKNGQDQYTNLQTYIDNLMHPEKLYDEWSKNYHESGAAKDMENLATQHGVNAASSLGLGGSNTALNAIQSGTAQIAEQDKQNYLKDLMEKYKTGAGLTQGVYNTGANTAGQMGTNAGKMGEDSANLTYGKDSSGGNMFSNILGRILPAVAGWAIGGTSGGGMTSGMYGGS